MCASKVITPSKKSKWYFYVSRSCRILIMVFSWAPALFPIERQQHYMRFGMVNHAVILRRITKKEIGTCAHNWAEKFRRWFKGAENICVFSFYLKCCSIVKSIKLKLNYYYWVKWFHKMTKHIHKIGEECSSCKYNKKS